MDFAINAKKVVHELDYIPHTTFFTFDSNGYVIGMLKYCLLFYALLKNDPFDFHFDINILHHKIKYFPYIGVEFGHRIFAWTWFHVWILCVDVLDEDVS